MRNQSNQSTVARFKDILQQLDLKTKKKGGLEGLK